MKRQNVGSRIQDSEVFDINLMAFFGTPIGPETSLDFDSVIQFDALTAKGTRGRDALNRPGAVSNDQECGFCEDTKPEDPSPDDHRAVTRTM
jgi:hypothetical protein